MAIYSVIKNEGPAKVLIWKHFEEDFNNNSQLIVAESEEALFMKDGIIVQTFPAGKYTLDTANYPIIKQLRSKLSGGKNQFSCKIYFVNKAHALELKWGTNPAMQMDDPRFGIVSVGAMGSYSIQVADGKKFLVKMVGSNISTFTSEEVNKYFRTTFISKIKMHIARYMKANKLSVLDLMTEYEEIAMNLIPILNEALDEYGVRLVNFNILAINIPEEDPNYERIKDASSRKKRLQEYGDDYGRLTGEAFMEKMTDNPTAGGISNAGMGLGMGLAAGQMMGNMMGQVFAPMGQNMAQGMAQGMQQQPPMQQPPVQQQPPQNNGQVQQSAVVCAACGTQNAPTSKFCCGCGQPLAPKKAFCPNCGAEMAPGAKFCGECGHRRDA